MSIQLLLPRLLPFAIVRMELEPMGSFELSSETTNGSWIIEMPMDLWQKCVATAYE
jgi:hypothetical protein